MCETVFYNGKKCNTVKELIDALGDKTQLALNEHNMLFSIAGCLCPLNIKATSQANNLFYDYKDYNNIHFLDKKETANVQN